MSLPAPDYASAVARPTAPGWYGLRHGALWLDRAIGTVCEAVGAALVMAEVIILFCGVVSRYVFDSPIFWTDELANFLFLWLSMLGMVVALRGDGHMRLTTLANWVPEHWARWFAAVASLVVIAFVLEILLPAAQYLEQQRFVELISLQISDGWRVVAILVGSGLAATIALLRLLETTTLRSFGLALLTVGGIAALLWIGQPVLLAMGFGSLIVFFVVIVAACVGIGVPIAFAFGIATLSYLGLTSAMPLSVVVNRMDEGMSNLLLLSVPMFVFLGLLMEMTGIARVMVAFLHWWATCAAACPTFCWVRCTWCPASPAQRRRTWRRWRRCCSPRCAVAAPIPASLRRCWQVPARCRRPFRRAWC
jgi:TRAP-type C4-dicarboxylate transport system permease small subunit